MLKLATQADAERASFAVHSLTCLSRCSRVGMAVGMLAKGGQAQLAELVRMLEQAGHDVAALKPLYKIKA